MTRGRSVSTSRVFLGWVAHVACLQAHCDCAAQDDAEAIASIERVQAFREKFGYSFVMENQLASACAAAINLSLDIVGNSEESFDIELVGSGQSNTFPLYSGNYQISTGVRLSLGTALQGRDIRTDADVWHRDGSDLYIGLNRPVRVYEAAEGAAEEAAHIERVNLPATISTHEGGASVSFLSNGYMEVETSAPATTQSSGWTAKELEDGGTLFYKYGAASALVHKRPGSESMNSAICLLERAAGLWGERCALADKAESLSYAELRARSRRAASGLLRRSGGRAPVMVWLPKSAAMVKGLCAALYAGRPCVPTDSAARPWSGCGR